MRAKRLRAIAAADYTTGADHTTTTRFVRTIRTLIGMASGALGVIFTWIQLSPFPFDILANNNTPILLWHGGLVLYYLSWIFGTNFDINVQELVYVMFLRRGRVPLHGFIVVLVLVVAGAALLWTQRYIQRFAIALDIFIVVDHLAWRYLIWLIKTPVHTSQTIYTQRSSYFNLEALNTVSYLIQGDWKWWRLIGTIPIVIVINAFAFSGTIHSYLTTTAISFFPSIFSTMDASAFLSSIFLLCFVLVAEIWVWVIRLKTHIALEFLDKLSDIYVLFPANRTRTQDVDAASNIIP